MTYPIDVSKLHIRHQIIGVLLVLAMAPAEARELPKPHAPKAGSNITVHASSMLEGIKALKPWGKPANSIIATPATEPRSLHRTLTTESSSTADELTVSPKAQPIVWNLDYPTPGKLKLGHWKFGQSKGIGLMASFPLSGKR
ncbi:hypothetical protein [uncultured Nevskia sp.]|uniref:hypothetical protein n=1 Tax=uncultured Nevskia sp. TaxID=228950 RepID=UPI0025E641C5|nr:hypothetical protein [uncultured Nevskia sp.]